MKLLCPNCGADKLPVRETRQSSEAIYRTRKCVECQWSYTTTESFAENHIPNIIRRPGKYGLAKRTEETSRS